MLALSYMEEDSNFSEINFNECILVSDIVRKDQFVYSSGHEPKELRYVLSFEQTTFTKEVLFSCTTFIDYLYFYDCIFSKGLSCNEAVFNDNVFIHFCHFSDCTYLQWNTFLNGIELEDCVFENHTIFVENKIENILHINDCTFEQSVNFYKTKFKGINGKIKAFFKGYCDFKQTNFDAQMDFEDCVFDGTTDFVKTKFLKSVSFKHIKVSDIILFKGDNKEKRIFSDIVDFEVRKKDITGKIIFQNANFNQISKISKQKLEILEKKGFVEVGSGCLKYRNTFQKHIKVSPNQRGLILDIAQTFASYFSRNESFSLGVEIIEKNNKEAILVYFTDENIDYQVFIQRIFKQENNLWDFIKSPIDIDTNDQNNSSFVEGIDSLDSKIHLLFSMFRLGLQSLKGKQEAEKLLDSICFSDENKDIKYSTIQEITQKFIIIFGNNNTVIEDVNHSKISIGS
ncbi:MAG: hypothetical protein EAZ95_08840 [Bacteroidetes bacterium]|nr:MAG: hypothetical protein EAZ95_08840 [Bacteroidota bacterium]